MAEHIKSITDVRKSLPKFSRSAKERMERYIITQHGEPQAVLLGFREYKGLLAAVELINHPMALKNLRQGIQEVHEGKGLTFEEMEGEIEQVEADQPASSSADQLIRKPIFTRIGTRKPIGDPSAVLARKAPKASAGSALRKAKG